MEMAWKFLDTSREWLIQNAEIFAVTGLLCIGIYYFPTPRHDTGWEYFAPRSYRRRGRKMRKDREAFVDNVLLNDFTDRIETRVMNGEITRAEAAVRYRRLKRVFPKVRDIFPSADRLKEKIKGRLGKHESVPLPDKSVRPKRKHAFAPIPERVVL